MPIVRGDFWTTGAGIEISTHRTSENGNFLFDNFQSVAGLDDQRLCGECEFGSLALWNV
jgi:hypothetical protein